MQPVYSSVVFCNPWKLIGVVRQTIDCRVLGFHSGGYLLARCKATSEKWPPSSRLMSKLNWRARQGKAWVLTLKMEATCSSECWLTSLALHRPCIPGDRTHETNAEGFLVWRESLYTCRLCKIMSFWVVKPYSFVTDRAFRRNILSLSSVLKCGFRNYLRCVSMLQRS